MLKKLSLCMICLAFLENLINNTQSVFLNKVNLTLTTSVPEGLKSFSTTTKADKLNFPLCNYCNELSTGKFQRLIRIV